MQTTKSFQDVQLKRQPNRRGRQCRRIGSTKSTENAQPKREGCLTVYLILGLLSTPLVPIIYFFYRSSLSEAYPNMPAWIIPILGVICIANFIFYIAIWKWKIWGMYGLYTSTGIVFLIIVMYTNASNVLSAFIGLVIFIFVFRDAWSKME